MAYNGHLFIHIRFINKGIGVSKTRQTFVFGENLFIEISTSLLIIKVVTDVDLSLEFLDSFHGPRCNDDLTSADLFSLHTTKECSHVISWFGLKW